MRKKYKYKNYKQGIFKPLNPEKYKGYSPIAYRSSYELKFMRWCDKNSNVLKWGSESIVIPYISPLDNKLHRYFVDNNITLKEKSGINKYLIEIKPYKQTLPPETKNRKSKKNLLYEQITYAKNCSKWEAAEQWCKKNNYKFLILTEKELKIK